MRSTVGPWRIADGNFDDPGSVETGEGRNKPMKFAVEIDVLENLGAIGFEGGAEVAQFDAGRAGHQPVGDTRGKLAGDGVVDAVLAPTAGDVVAFFDLLEEGWDVFRVMLEVAIERDDNLTLSFVESGGQRGGLSEVAAETDDFQTVIGLDEVGEQIEAAISGSIIDEDDLVRLLHRLEHGRETGRTGGGWRAPHCESGPRSIAWWESLHFTVRSANEGEYKRFKGRIAVGLAGSNPGDKFGGGDAIPCRRTGNCAVGAGLSAKQAGGRCVLCGATTGFIDIAQGEWGEAADENGLAIPLFAAFAMNGMGAASYFGGRARCRF